MTRQWYRTSDWDGWRVACGDERGGPYVVCHYGFGWYRQWLAGPFEDADDAAEYARCCRPHFRAGTVTPAVVAIRPLEGWAR